MRNRAAKAGRGMGAVLQQRTNAIIDNSFSSTKKDKQTIKHNAFVGRIEKANQKSMKKRRRPSKKLVATLESLADALPHIEEGGLEEAVVGQAKIRLTSLKSKPGAMKRKEKVEKLERERFGKNMADMAGLVAMSDAAVTDGQQDGASTKPPVNRWAALRSFISATLEQNPEFAKKNTPAT